MARRFGKVVVAALVAGSGLVSVAPTVGVAAGPCSASATRTLSGAQPRFTTTLNPNERVNANAATWAVCCHSCVAFARNAGSAGLLPS